MNDLVQEAGLLMKAADKFDPDRGLGFLLMLYGDQSSV